jgi:hypothetical protein
MSSISLRKQQVINLKKEAGIDKVKAQVVLVLDRSGSMDTMYNNGTVQETLERILPIGMAFDDNEEVDFYLFHDRAFKAENLTKTTIAGLANRVNKKYSTGGTSYAPPIRMIMEEMGMTKTEKVTSGGFLGFGKKETEKTTKVSGPADYPVYVIFITDGANFDKGETEQAIIEASRLNIFIQFVGIGGGAGSFPFLEKLDILQGRALDNVSFMNVQNLSTTTDDTLYRGLMKEFPKWYKDAVAKGIVKQQ